MLGRSGSLAYEPWPEADESLLVQSTYNLPVQVGLAPWQAVRGQPRAAHGGHAVAELGPSVGPACTAAGCFKAWRQCTHGGENLPTT